MIRRGLIVALLTLAPAAAGAQPAHPAAAKASPAPRARPAPTAATAGATVLALNGGAAQVAVPGRPERMDPETLSVMGPSFISLALIHMLAEHPAAAQGVAEDMAKVVMAGEGWATPAGEGAPFFAVADFATPAQVAMLELPLRCPSRMPDPQPGQPAVACHLVTVHGLTGLEVTSTRDGQVTDIFRVIAANGRFYELMWRSAAPTAAGAAEVRRFMDSLTVK